ncbi:MAG: hypothetical protein PHE50_10255 [Dehalococcoidales bacterium]|nr:hypothetical protein [Dehalococcoidales bacterium]
MVLVNIESARAGIVFVRCMFDCFLGLFTFKRWAVKSGALSIVVSAIFFFGYQFPAHAGKNAKANPVSNIRASTAAKVTAIVEKKKVSQPKKGGYHVGSDTRYQPSKKDASVTKLSGGKGSDGKYRSVEKR